MHACAKISCCDDVIYTECHGLWLGLPTVPYFPGCPVFRGLCPESPLGSSRDATCPVFLVKPRSKFFDAMRHQFTLNSTQKLYKKTQLSPRDRVMRRVNWNLANCHATVQKLLIGQVLTKSMVWSWRFSRQQCEIDNVHSTMTRPSRLPLSQAS